MPAHRTPASRGWAATAALLTAVALTACGDGEGDDDGNEVIGGSPGLNERVTEDLEIADLVLEYPEDGLYEEGEDVTLFAALTNTGSSAYQLVDVVGPDFADARLIPLDGDSGSIEIPEDDNAYLQPEGPPSVILEDLGTTLRSSQSLEVTFVFEDAEGELGEVTLDAPVAPDQDDDDPEFDAPQDPSSDD
ncbi:copper chaperone PCu(A)C [Blastococcus goldschmidtiae]|uniref:Copper(I)-binding protein n=1 Tax=Blastococcus goldschmidtiae TaxID=3075546 RepID=A0ABU2K6U7_9ACTN|nr:hypothetical protein [Blastococcus sp. DSM 46792]MDT0275897.1 hypothetical protein [Blastococcus sp. DSM 46792]